jgi:predicted phage terminase large subunit-like protein
MNREDIVQLLRDIDQDILAAAKVLFPNIFTEPFDPIHRQIASIIEYDNGTGKNKNALAAPRGIGKTSLANLVLPTVRALLGRARYVVPISATATQAEEQSENLKYEFTHNENILALFGDVRTDVWSKEKWILKTPEHEVCIFPRGGGQEVRGKNWRGYRPDLIIFDDLEKAKEMNNERIRDERWAWLNSDVLKSINLRKSARWDIVMIGTILHHDSILQRILESEQWYTGRFELCDDDFNSNAPHLFSKEDLIREYEQHEKDGILDVFFRELRNIPTVVGKDAPFQAQFFRKYDPGFVNFQRRGIEHIVIVDPAKTANMRSAESAVVTVAIDMMQRKIYVRDIMRGKWHPDEVYNRTIESAKFYKADVVAVEKTGLDEFITYPMKNALFMAGVYAEFMELNARGGVGEKGKIARVRSLSPFYRQGMIEHNPLTCQALESQLLQFPNAKYWDVMDAFGYIIEILEKGGRYMSFFDPQEDMDMEEIIARELAELELAEEDPFNYAPTGFRLV